MVHLDGPARHARISDRKQVRELKKVVYYMNQFYGGIGGEDKAGCEPFIQDTLTGPGTALNGQLKGGTITHTIVCGDDYMNEHPEEAVEKISGFLKGIEFDLFIAGPAFFAGRYGVNCGRICKYIQEKFQVPAFTCMYEEAPGVEMFRRDVYILRCGNSAAAMRKALKSMSAFANKFLNGEEILWADAEGYFSRGIRQQIILPEDQTADNRAVDMLLKKIHGEPFQTEMPIEMPERAPVPPAVRDMSSARVAFVSTGGIVPIGNPDKIKTAAAISFATYEYPEDGVMRPGEWESIHGGYDQKYADANPMTHIPADALRRAEREGKMGWLLPYYFSTTGNLTSLTNAVKMAKEIGDRLREENIQAVILGSA